VVIIYLQGKDPCPFLRFISLEGRPYHNLGFSLVGFTAFHPCSFPQGSVTVALLQVLGPYPEGLRSVPGRQSGCPGLPWLMVSPGTNTTGIAARASMDFPLRHKPQRLPERR
jgi:hypothetical protein